MDFTDIIKEINYFSYLGAFIKWILLSLAVCAALLVLAYKLDWFKRQNRIVNIIVKCYYFLLPLCFIYFGANVAPIVNSQKQINIIIDNHKVELKTYTSQFLSYFLNDSTNFRNISAKDAVKHKIQTYIEGNRGNSEPNKGLGKRFLGNTSRKIEYGFLSKIIESKLIKKSANVIGADKHVIKQLYTANLDQLFNEGEIIESFKHQINFVFWQIYKSMFLIFGIILLIPTLEIVLAKKLNY